MDIDYALAWDFIDPNDGRPYRLRFRHDGHFSDTGQLIAVVSFKHHASGHTIAISRPGVTYHDVEAVLDGWQNWAKLTEDTVNLGAIRRRIHDTGLA